ncbi:MAG TPA: DUF1501 domain-containing protein, partial [Acidimicrobiales bacterium]|nr:DUF1501 domain-containing protein [Acidimicrobiales bacterium]
TLTIDRRQFLTGVLGGGIAAGVVRFSGLTSLLSMAEASAATVPLNGPFVLCTLYGGNDGLNTVVPYESGIYRDWRQGLAIGGEQVLPLGSDSHGHLGFHPSLKGMYALWQQGKVAIIQGVEYPHPNFSHFASQSIWQTAQLSGDPASGWLGRWLDVTGTGPMRALSVGPTLPPALIGDKQRAGAVVDSTSPGSQLPGQGSAFTGAYRQLMSSFPGEPTLQAGQANAGANFLTIGSEAAAALSKEHAPAGAGDGGDIGNQLAIVAELISYGLPTSVYSVSWSSFDTHSDQAGTHADLLSALDVAVSSFMGAFPKAEPGKSPVVMIYSEFGRTPRANASGGTDHSSASVVLVVGPAVKGGFYGAMPSFTRLDQWDNLIYTTDFRRVYATILERCLGMETPVAVLGGSWRPIEFL